MSRPIASSCVADGSPGAGHTPCRPRLSVWTPGYTTRVPVSSGAMPPRLPGAGQREPLSHLEPKAESLLRAGRVWGRTTLSPAMHSAQTSMRLSRCRWPVESARKRWPSGLDGNALRAQATRPLAEMGRQGQRLYALRLERRRRHQLGDSRGRLEHERLGTWIALP